MVEDIEYVGDEAKILLDDKQKFTISRNHPAMPCLWNGWMAPQEVILGIDQETNEINDCKLYAFGVRELKNVRKREY